MLNNIQSILKDFAEMHLHLKSLLNFHFGQICGLVKQRMSNEMKMLYWELRRYMNSDVEVGDGILKKDLKKEETSAPLLYYGNHLTQSVEGIDCNFEM
jgi:hypothetical protein